MSQAAVRLLFVGLLVAMMMSSLNQTVLSTALPTIVGELNGVEHLLWVSTAFMIASTIMMPIYGRLGDVFGRKLLFFFAIMMFLVGSLLGLCAHSMDVLIVGRVFQGIGGGGLMILSQAIIAAVVPARERGTYMGALGATFAVASVAGPLIGGWLTEGPGWRWAFAVNFPLGIAAIITTAVFLRIPAPTHTVRPRIDYAGMVLIAVFTTSLILTTAWGGHQFGWSHPVIVVLIALVFVSGTIFVWVEVRVPAPLVPMRLFRDRNFVVATTAGVIIGLGMFGVLSYLPTYLQMVHGLGATTAGLLMAPMMGTMMVMSMIVGRLQTAFGKYKVYPIFGVILIGLSLIGIGTLQVHTPAWVVASYLGLMGLGLGLSVQTLVLVVQNSFPVTMVGTATGVNNFFRQMGGTIGMSFIGALFTARLFHLMEERSLDLGPQAQTISDSRSLTPNMVSELTDELHTMVVTSYNDALTPIFLWLSPILILALLMTVLVKEIPLGTRLHSSTTVSTDTGSLGFVPESGSAADAQAQSVPLHERIEDQPSTQDQAAADKNAT